MNPELKQKWIDALRSGDYEQGYGSLRNTNDEYCCLGVLCDVAGTGWSIGDSSRYSPNGNDGFVGGIVNDLLEDLGLSNVHMNALISLNDSDRRPFHGIADYIERNIS